MTNVSLHVKHTPCSPGSGFRLGRIDFICPALQKRCPSPQKRGQNGYRRTGWPGVGGMTVFTVSVMEGLKSVSSPELPSGIGTMYVKAKS